MTDKPSILFVDDQNNVLQGLRRSLRALEDIWTINYASGGKEALKVMENMRVDVIVADTNMPGMRGPDLLHAVQEQYPQTIRMVLSGGGSRSDDTSTLLRTSHQFFSKPFDTDKLKETIERLLGLREYVSDDRLRRVTAGVSKVPCAPRIYKEFKQERDSPASDLEHMAQLIAQDPGLSAKMLQSLNSTFFGVSKSGIHPLKAAQMTGPGTLCYLFDEDSHVNTIERDHRNYALLEKIYRRSLQRAYLVEALTAAEGLPEILKYNAFTTGMLADIGLIIMAFNMEEEYARIIPMFKDMATQRQTEKAAFGGTHDDVGAYFLGLWGFPQSAINAVIYSHRPEQEPEQAVNLTTMVHIANALLSSDDLAVQTAQMNMEYLAKLGLAGHGDKWNAIKKDVLAVDIVKNWSFS